MTPEQQARLGIDARLAAAGWHVCHLANVNLNAGTGPARSVAIREFPLLPGHGFADHLLYVNGKACGVIEAKRQGATLSGVEAEADTAFQRAQALRQATLARAFSANGNQKQTSFGESL